MPDRRSGPHFRDASRNRPKAASFIHGAVHVGNGANSPGRVNRELVGPALAFAAFAFTAFLRKHPSQMDLLTGGKHAAAVFRTAIARAILKMRFHRP
jgi:hypothetical protein